MREENKKQGKYTHPNQTNNTELPVFSTPDPGLFPNPITGDNKFYVINPVELSHAEFDSSSTERNTFLNLEGLEVRSNSPPQNGSDSRASSFTQYFPNSVFVECFDVLNSRFLKSQSSCFYLEIHRGNARLNFSVL